MLRRLAVLGAVGTVLLTGAAAALAEPGRPPPFEARAVLVANGGTGEVLFARDAGSRQAIASITKIMTALVVLEHAGLDELVTVVGPAPRVGESTVSLRVGERLPVRHLLEAVLIQSANDAAYALAAHVGGPGGVARFVDLMNRKARALDLESTRFVRPDGLDVPGHYSTARDVFALAQVAMRDPRFRRIVATRTARIAGGRTLRNWNDLLGRYPGLIGVKTGHTTVAGWSEVAAARRAGVTIYAVLLGSPGRERRNADLAELLDWGFDQYRRVAVVRPGRTYARALVPFSERRLRLVAADGARAVVRVGRPLVQQVVAPAMVELPIREGDRLGEVRVYSGGKLVASRALIAFETIEEPSLVHRVRWYAGRALDHVRDMLESVFGAVT